MVNEKKKAKKTAISSRPPIVAVLGHVDHGKSTLLDYIRNTEVTSQEAGGITQAIGAYQAHVTTKDGERLVTFIDTPGHQAFTKMRSRGAQVADLAILVVAADDGVMPQTIESISHIRAAKIPMVVAINKIDLPNVNIKRVKRQLAKVDVLVEEFGGDVVSVPVSAKTGQGVDELLGMVILVSDLTGLQGDINAPFSGAIIESRRDRRRGPLATVVVKNGLLRIGDSLLAEEIGGRVRNMFDEYGRTVEKALPGQPVEVIGWDDVPPVGALVIVGARQKKLGAKPSPSTMPSTDALLNMVVKADSAGSLEAIRSILPDEVAVVSSGVGDITESDVLFAKTTGSIIIGFRTRVLSAAAKLAELEEIIIKTDNVIYRLAEEVEEVIQAVKSGELEKILGEAQILAEFSVRGDRIAGVRVNQGRLAQGDIFKLVRVDKEIARGRIKSLRIGKRDVTRVETGKECGVRFAVPLDFRVGDAIISYRK